MWAEASGRLWEELHFGQWVVRRIRDLITQMYTRTLQCTQVLLCASRNLECQTATRLALWWEWRHWVYSIVSFCRFLPSVTTTRNFKPLDSPMGSVSTYCKRIPNSTSIPEIMLESKVGLGKGSGNSFPSLAVILSTWLDFCESVFSSVKWR